MGPVESREAHGGWSRSRMGWERLSDRADEVDGAESTVCPATAVLPEMMRRVGSSAGERRAEAWAQLCARRRRGR